MSTKQQEVYRVAHELFRQDPDWVTFFREVLGLDGVVRRVYQAPEELAQFEQSNEYQEIQAMLARLRERGLSRPSAQEPTKVITVRMPKSLHDALQREAHERHTSMNRLCIGKLLQVVDEEMIPTK